MDTRKNIYPFTAIVGQEKMKKALILNVINSKIGGVLIRGEKGTAKSTAVRALADLLPDKKVVELPVSSTEDRVAGTLDIEHTLKTGEKRFEPGVLAEADENILYVDEVNLLDDHIVDLLLDAAAMGVNIVEREGISYSHPARFILVGTMNPEEGDLRPQLLDRFGLTVEVIGEQNVKDRVEVIKRRLAFEENPEEFCNSFEKEQEKLVKDIENARGLLDKVQLKDQLLELTAEIAVKMGVDGHRADITMIKTAKTLAAFNQRTEVTEQDILEAAELVLPHRMRRKPFEESSLNIEQLSQWIRARAEEE
ncbi:MAG: AAA family ATPase [Halanaerobiales bacterium]|nr:AAA family ATPase [Halanaerobiales bacterium]